MISSYWRSKRSSLGETVNMRSDENSDNFLYKKDRCRDRFNSGTAKKGPSDRQ